ncbi:MAG: collagen-like protein, partial [Puniceicoccales bacterium]|nr:collagen-like protein [Puniceicoccales bacterium]
MVSLVRRVRVWAIGILAIIPCVLIGNEEDFIFTETTTPITNRKNIYFMGPGAISVVDNSAITFNVTSDSEIFSINAYTKQGSDPTISAGRNNLGSPNQYNAHAILVQIANSDVASVRINLRSAYDGRLFAKAIGVNSATVLSVVRNNTSNPPDVNIFIDPDNGSNQTFESWVFSENTSETEDGSPVDNKTSVATGSIFGRGYVGATKWVNSDWTFGRFGDCNNFTSNALAMDSTASSIIFGAGSIPADNTQVDNWVFRGFGEKNSFNSVAKSHNKGNAHATIFGCNTTGEYIPSLGQWTIGRFGDQSILIADATASDPTTTTTGSKTAYAAIFGTTKSSSITDNTAVCKNWSVEFGGNATLMATASTVTTDKASVAALGGYGNENMRYYFNDLDVPEGTNPTVTIAAFAASGPGISATQGEKIKAINLGKNTQINVGRTRIMVVDWDSDANAQASPPTGDAKISTANWTAVAATGSGDATWSNVAPFFANTQPSLWEDDGTWETNDSIAFGGSNFANGNLANRRIGPGTLNIFGRISNCDNNSADTTSFQTGNKGACMRIENGWRVNCFSPVCDFQTIEVLTGELYLHSKDNPTAYNEAIGRIKDKNNTYAFTNNSCPINGRLIVWGTNMTPADNDSKFYNGVDTNSEIISDLRPRLVFGCVHDYDVNQYPGYSSTGRIVLTGLGATDEDWQMDIKGNSVFALRLFPSAGAIYSEGNANGDSHLNSLVVYMENLSKSSLTIPEKHQRMLNLVKFGGTNLSDFSGLEIPFYTTPGQSDDNLHSHYYFLDGKKNGTEGLSFLLLQRPQAGSNQDPYQIFLGNTMQHQHVVWTDRNGKLGLAIVYLTSDGKIEYDNTPNIFIGDEDVPIEESDTGCHCVTGPPGPAGKDGKDANPSEVAGILKSDTEFQNMVRGPKGDTGPTGPAGNPGTSGGSGGTGCDCADDCYIIADKRTAGHGFILVAPDSSYVSTDSVHGFRSTNGIIKFMDSGQFTCTCPAPPQTLEVDTGIDCIKFVSTAAEGGIGNYAGRTVSITGTTTDYPIMHVIGADPSDHPNYYNPYFDNNRGTFVSLNEVQGAEGNPFTLKLSVASADKGTADFGYAAKNGSNTEDYFCGFGTPTTENLSGYISIVPSETIPMSVILANNAWSTAFGAVSCCGRSGTFKNFYVGPCAPDSTFAAGVIFGVGRAISGANFTVDTGQYNYDAECSENFSHMTIGGIGANSTLAAKESIFGAGFLSRHMSREYELDSSDKRECLNNFGKCTIGPIADNVSLTATATCKMTSRCACVFGAAQTRGRFLHSTGRWGASGTNNCDQWTAEFQGSATVTAMAPFSVNEDAYGTLISTLGGEQNSNMRFYFNDLAAPYDTKPNVVVSALRLYLPSNPTEGVKGQDAWIVGSGEVTAAISPKQAIKGNAEEALAVSMGPNFQLNVGRGRAMLPKWQERAQGGRKSPTVNGTWETDASVAGGGATYVIDGEHLRRIGPGTLNIIGGIARAYTSRYVTPNPPPNTASLRTDMPGGILRVDNGWEVNCFGYVQDLRGGLHVHGSHKGDSTLNFYGSVDMPTDSIIIIGNGGAINLYYQSNVACPAFTKALAQINDRAAFFADSASTNLADNAETIGLYQTDTKITSNRAYQRKGKLNITYPGGADVSFDGPFGTDWSGTGGQDGVVTGAGITANDNTISSKGTLSIASGTRMLFGGGRHCGYLQLNHNNITPQQQLTISPNIKISLLDTNHTIPDTFDYWIIRFPAGTTSANTKMQQLVSGLTIGDVVDQLISQSEDPPISWGSRYYKIVYGDDDGTNSLLDLSGTAYEAKWEKGEIKLLLSNDSEQPGLFIVGRIPPAPRGPQGIQGIKGDTGDKGSDGEDGPTASEVASELKVDSDFQELVRGPQGESGADGEDADPWEIAGILAINESFTSDLGDMIASNEAFISDVAGNMKADSDFQKIIQGEQGEQGPQGESGADG